MTLAWVDRDDDLALALDAIRRYQAELGEDLCFQAPDDTIEALRGHYGPPGGVALWFDGGRAVGVVCVRKLDEHRAELKRLWVVPEYRGRGWGRALVEAALERARAAGFREIVLDSLDRLKPALELYRSLGFVSVEPYTTNPLPGAVFLGRTLFER